MKIKRVLVLGGGGFIGINLVKMLVQRQWTVWIYELPGSNVNKLLMGSSVNVVFGTLADTNKIIEVVEQQNISLIIHLISSIIPNSTFNEYRGDQINVVYPTFDLIHIMGLKKIKFVFLSSGGSIYGENNLLIPFVETDPLMPICYYGQSKLTIEEMIRLESRYTGLEYLIIRPSNPYGPGQRIDAKQGFISTVIGKALRHEEIVIWGDGTVVRDYIYIEDLVSIICRLIDAEESGVFNVGSGKGYSLNNILSILDKNTNIPLKVRYAEKRNIDVSFSLLDINKLRKVLTPNFIDIEEGIYRFWAYVSSSDN